MQGNQLALAKEEPEVAAEVPVPVDVQTFESPFGKARAVIFSDGTPWFVALDACVGLGLGDSNVSNHLSRLAEDQKQKLMRQATSNSLAKDRLVELFGPFGSHLMVITRGGFNDLILESRKPAAREYRQWVTADAIETEGA